MITMIDARGLSCPEPALRTRQALLQADNDTVTVRVDSEASRENVGRMARHAGWQAAVSEEPDGSFTLTLTR